MRSCIDGSIFVTLMIYHPQYIENYLMINLSLGQLLTCMWKNVIRENLIEQAEKVLAVFLTIRVMLWSWANWQSVKLYFTDMLHLLRRSTSNAEQIAEPDPFRFGSNFVDLFIEPRPEILKNFGPLDPPLLLSTFWKM